MQQYETFCSKKIEYGSLSNFWNREVVIDDRIYESGEHAFHGEKYKRISDLCTDENRKRELLEYSIKFLKENNMFSDPSKAKSGGGKKGLRLNDMELNTWNNICINVQMQICNYKFNTYDEVKNDILKSGDKVLVHSAMRTSEEKMKYKFWEGKWVVRDGVGMVLGGNKLGDCWMRLREYKRRCSDCKDNFGK
jgi:predicted NAD-dependent protein-ADP-ribosyltransferase YbiA (DUF1768 family)